MTLGNSLAWPNHRAPLGAGRKRCLHVAGQRPGPSEHARYANS
jgi:hypothetical protein